MRLLDREKQEPHQPRLEIGLPRSGGPVSILVHNGSWRYGLGGRRSGSGWRSRPLHDLGSWRAIAKWTCRGLVPLL